MSNLANILAKASKISVPSTVKNSPSSVKLYELIRQQDGARIFKRKALGLFGEEAVKTQQELAVLLYEAGAANSLEHAELLATNFEGEAYYSPSKILRVTPLDSSKENYRIVSYKINS